MAEIYGAIVGAVLTYFLMLIASRFSPHYIQCKNFFYRRITSPPNTQFLYNNKKLDTLYISGLDFRNLGKIPIQNPVISVVLSEASQVLDVSPSIEPMRSDISFKTKINLKRSEVKFEFDKIFPYKLNSEVISLDILAKNEFTIESVIGNGENLDHSSWTVKYSTFNNDKNLIIVPKILRLNYAIFFAALVYITLLNPSQNIFHWNFQTISNYFKNPVIISIFVWFVGFVVWAFYMGIKGWYLKIKIPFIKKALYCKISSHDKHSQS